MVRKIRFSFVCLCFWLLFCVVKPGGEVLVHEVLTLLVSSSGSSGSSKGALGVVRGACFARGEVLVHGERCLHRGRGACT